MILDILENAHRYFPLNKGFQKAFAFLMQPGLTQLPVDKYEIDGERVYAMVAKDSGRDKGDALLEAHEKYIDIQMVLEGIDHMGWKPTARCARPCKEYDQERDIMFFPDEPADWLSVDNGVFAIFFPEDAHMPLISSGRIHKVVVKVAVA